MKKISLLFLILMIPLLGQNITNKLGGTSDSETYDITDSNGQLLFQVTGQGRVGIGTTAYDELLHVGGNSIFWGSLDIRNTGGTTLFKVLSSGKVGVGTASPDELFDVNGNMRVYGDFILDDGFRDSNYELGTAGQILSSTGTATDWIDAQTISLIPSGNTLDQAYDQGGAGVGRTITADNGAFKVQGVDGALFTGTHGTGTIPTTGAGTRLMWYPAKSAFRAGYVNSNQWDADSIGNYSTAMGYQTKAVGDRSIALGYITTARGSYSTATGRENSASGSDSFVMNRDNTASGYSSLAGGRSSTANGGRSIAFGYGASTDGTPSFSFGAYTSASGSSSLATGTHTTASGNNTSAMGSYVSTGNHPGSFIIGDNSGSSSDITNSDNDNQMTMIFIGGYKFFTNDAASTGAALASGANSWSSISDSTKKENFQTADGEYFLDSINKLKLGSWNYKAQDSSIRHYGPMAQDIFKYFGKDDFGTIGNDTTLATADMDGIMMIAIQALIKENKELKLEKDEEIAFLKSEIEELKQLIIGRE